MSSHGRRATTLALALLLAAPCLAESETLGFVVTANTVKSLLVDRNRGFFGFDAMLLSGAMAEAFKLPQSGGFLVKQVAKDSVADKLGLKGGDRIGIVEGQHIVVGGDIFLAVQGMTMASAADRAVILRKLENIQEGEDLRVKVFRGGKIVELATIFTGF